MHLDMEKNVQIYIYIYYMEKVHKIYKVKYIMIYLFYVYEKF